MVAEKVMKMVVSMVELTVDMMEPGKAGPSVS
jgi:hypothetical protein